MTNLEDLVEPLKREVAVPGTFDTVYKSTSDVDLEGSLADAFGAAQIDGFFLNQTITDPDAEVQAVTPDLSPAGKAVIVIYAAERILTAQIMSLKQRVAYEAGPVKYETENSASVLSEILKQMRLRRTQILDSVQSMQYAVSISTVDMYADRIAGLEGLGIMAGERWGFYPYELGG